MLERKAFYSPQEVAELAGLSTSTILNYIRSEKLYAVKLSERVYRIPLASLLATFFPQLKRPPKVTKRTTTRADLDAKWERELREIHAEYDRLTARRTAPPVRSARRPRKAVRHA